MKKSIFLVCLVLITSTIFSQNLPDRYRTISLGMTMEQVKTKLENDTIYNYRGERDVSLLPSENKSIIETSSDTWLENCWFQFYNNELYSIIINYNPEKFDYNTIYNQLIDKYGLHNEMDPTKAIWEDDFVIMSLEKPISVKYINKKIFNDIRTQATVEKTKEEETRDSILGDL